MTQVFKPEQYGKSPLTEDPQVFKQRRRLLEREKKNLYLSVAVGCLRTVCDTIPGPNHQRRKRELLQLSDEVLRYASPRISSVSDANFEIFKKTIQASEKVMADILKETGGKATHVLLNLAGFCMEELPLKDSLYWKYNSLFDMWADATKYQDIRSGERIFARIDSELQILVAQEGGLLL